jgi:hypothetical protein
MWIDCGKAVSFTTYVCATAASTCGHKNIKGACYVSYSVILFSPFFCSFLNLLGLRFGGKGKCIVAGIILSNALLIVYLRRQKHSISLFFINPSIMPNCSIPVTNGLSS